MALMDHRNSHALACLLLVEMVKGKWILLGIYMWMPLVNRERGKYALKLGEKR